MSIEVRTSYTYNGSFELDAVANRAIGRNSDFSGVGFGMRDLGWVARSDFEAQKIKRALDKIGLHAEIRTRAE